jgi:hypothetical protein
MHATAAIPVAAIVVAGMLVSTIGAFEAPARIRSFRASWASSASRARSRSTPPVATGGVHDRPALCGFLISFGGPGARVRVRRAARDALDPRAQARFPTAVGEVEEGALSWKKVLEVSAFVRNNPVVLGCMTLDMMAVIFGGAGALLPRWRETYCTAGPREYGLLAAGIDLGAVAATVLLLGMRPVGRVGRVLSARCLAYGLAMIAFGLRADRSRSRSSRTRSRARPMA